MNAECARRPKAGRVALGDFSPRAPTDPDVRDYRIRLFRWWFRYEGEAHAA